MARHGLLVSMAVGDAVGLGFEFAPSEFVKTHNDLTYVRNPNRPKHVPGSYSDDTQMLLALAEFMLSGQPLTTLNLADAFVETFKRDPRTGYARGFYDLLIEVKDGTELLRRLYPHSEKSGGAMRAPVLGFLSDPEVVRDRAMWQASVTHATLRGQVAAAGAAMLTWHCMRGLSRRELLQSVGAVTPGWITGFRAYEPVPSDGIRVVEAAINAISRTKSTMAEILRDCISYEGDTDTVAAIAMAAASQHPDIEQDIPDHLIDGLENGPYGRDYLAKIDAQLEAMFSPQSVKEDDPDDDGLDDDIISFFSDPPEDDK